MGYRSTGWFVASVLTLGLAVGLTYRAQFYDETPPFSVAVGVSPRSDRAAVIQYAVLQGAPFLHVRYPSGTRQIVITDLLLSSKAAADSATPPGQAWKNTTKEGPFGDDDAIEAFFQGLFDLGARWYSEHEDERRVAEGKPQIVLPFPNGLPADPNNPAICLVNTRVDPIDRYTWEPLPDHAIVEDAGQSADTVIGLGAKYGFGSAVFVIDTTRLAGETAAADDGDLWCRLRRPAAGETAADRKLEIWNEPLSNALRSEASRESVAATIAPLFIESPFGNGARDVQFSANLRDPLHQGSAQVIEAGESITVDWTDGVSASFHDIVLVVIGAVYALALTMLLEALRPLIESKHQTKTASEPDEP